MEEIRSVENFDIFSFMCMIFIVVTVLQGWTRHFEFCPHPQLCYHLDPPPDYSWEIDHLNRRSGVATRGEETRFPARHSS